MFPFDDVIMCFRYLGSCTFGFLWCSIHKHRSTNEFELPIYIYIYIYILRIKLHIFTLKIVQICRQKRLRSLTVNPKKYAHGFCFAVLCCGYTLTDFPISIRLTSLALWQSNDCPSASKATLMNMDKYFMWIHYERLHNHNKAKHNKTVCIFLGIYCMSCCRSTAARTLSYVSDSKE